MASYLLDTQAFLWWLGDEGQLGTKARAAIGAAENEVLVSAATTWEIAIKRHNGKLEAPGDIESWIAASGFSELAIEVGHSVRAGELPDHHRDPFDRMLVAQAQLEELIVITSDPDIAKYGVAVLDASA